jgi:hypothetical protein
MQNKKTMRNYRNLIISILIVLVTAISITESYSQKEDILKYKVNRKFTGEIRNGVDSVYLVTCTLDKRSLIKARKLYVTMGSEPGLADIFKVSLDSAYIVAGSENKLNGVRKDGNILEIELGEYPAGTKYIDVWTWSRSKNNEGENLGEHKRAIQDEALVIDEEK